MSFEYTRDAWCLRTSYLSSPLGLLCKNINILFTHEWMNAKSLNDLPKIIWWQVKNSYPVFSDSKTEALSTTGGNQRLSSEAEIWWRTRIITTGFTQRSRSSYTLIVWFRNGPAFAKGYQASMPLCYFSATTRCIPSPTPSQSYFPGREEGLSRFLPSWASRSLIELSREKAGKETI